MKIKKFREDVKLPTRSHSTDAGLDCYMPDGFVIKPFETLCIGLGFGILVPENYAAMFVPRSSTAKKGLICQTSIVDCGYTGEVHLIVTNCSNNTYTFEKNDRLVSLITYKYLNEEFEEVNEFPKTERGENGLGSSGK